MISTNLLVPPDRNRHAQVRWLEDLVAWLSQGPLTDRLTEALLDQQERRHRQNARWTAFIEALEKDPKRRDLILQTVRALLLEPRALRLFSETGLRRKSGFFTDLGGRFTNLFLPQPLNGKDLIPIFSAVFAHKEVADWLADLSLQKLQKFLYYFEPTTDFTALRTSMIDAILLLAIRASNLGLSQDIQERSPKATFPRSPFVELVFVARELVTSLQESDRQSAEDIYLRFLPIHQECQVILQDVYQHLSEVGVSVDLVYRLEQLDQILERLQTLLILLLRFERDDSESLLKALRFCSNLIRLQEQDRSLRGFLRSQLHLLARKIVEHTGHHGEHYITRNWDEYMRLLLAAAGGGILTAFTTIFKFVIGWAKLPLFFEGFLTTLNYSGSFIAMQLTGMTLATKQPSMTASALAAKMTENSSEESFAEEVAQLIRSQIAAFAGNLGLVIPTVLAMESVHSTILGRSLLDTQTAHYVLYSLNPLESLTIPLAMLTGVLLWFSGFVTGWVDNWLAYNHITKAVARDYRLIRLFGERRVVKLSWFIGRHLPGFGGNLAIGLSLAATPILGKFTGLPLDVRHVTLSTGALTLALCAMERAEIAHPDVFWAILGIACIGFLNFIVSFLLSLDVAARSRNVNRQRMRVYTKAVLMKMLRSPWQFIFP